MQKPISFFNHRCCLAVLALTVVSCGGVANTECDISQKAIESDLRADQQASVPKVCFAVDGTERCFYLLMPDCAKSTVQSTVQLVVDLHDTGSCPIEQSRISGWKEYAMSECFLVAWPLGTTDPSIADEPCFTVPGGIQVTNDDGEPWGVAPDCCCQKDGKYIDESATNDIVFLHQMISKAIDEAEFNNIAVNSTRVRLTGYGNGATAAMGFTAIHSEVVSCLAPFSGHMVTQFAQDYVPVPVFSVMDTANAEHVKDQEVPDDSIVSPIGSGPHILPSPSRVDLVFATANDCGEASSRSNVATDKTNKKEGVVTGGKFAECEEPVNFLRPPFAAYKNRGTVEAKAAFDTGKPVNRVVDTTGIALLFCKDRQSAVSAYQPTSGSTRITIHHLAVVIASVFSMAVAMIA